MVGGITLLHVDVRLASASVAMTAKFYVAVLLIVMALGALRRCHPHTGDYDRKIHEVEPK